MKFRMVLTAILLSLSVKQAFAERDKVNHIVSVAGVERVMSDVIRIVSQEVVNEQQVRNIDSLWSNNGSFILESEKRQYTLDPREAQARGVMGAASAGETVMILVLSHNSDSRAKAWWVRIDQIAYFPNQTVNGRPSADQLGWRVSNIWNAQMFTPPRGCNTRKYDGATIIPISNDGLNYWCDQMGRY